MLDSFARDLTPIICGKTCENEDEDGKPVMIKISEYQADTNIAKCMIDGEADAIISGDIYFSMCLGSSGRHFDLMIKDLTFDKKDLSVKTAKFVTG